MGARLCTPDRVQGWKARFFGSVEKALPALLVQARILTSGFVLGSPGHSCTLHPTFPEGSSASSSCEANGAIFRAADVCRVLLSLNMTA